MPSFKKDRYINAPLHKFVRDLAARTPAPGGGAVAALAAAQSAALVEMAAAYTLGKPAYKAVAKTMRAIRSRAARSRALCTRLIDEDITAYRAQDMRRAVAVPLRVASAARLLCDDAATVFRKGNKNLRSDAGLAVLLAQTAFLAGLVYAAVNLKRDKKSAQRFRKDFTRLKRAAPRVRARRRKTEAALGYSLGR